MAGCPSYFLSGMFPTNYCSTLNKLYVEHSSFPWSYRNVFVAGDCVIRKVKRDWKIRNGSVSHFVRLLVTPTVVVGSHKSLLCLARPLRTLSILFRVVRIHYILFRVSFVSVTFTTISLTLFSYTTFYLVYFNFNSLRLTSFLYNTFSFKSFCVSSSLLI